VAEKKMSRPVAAFFSLTGPQVKSLGIHLSLLVVKDHIEDII